MVGSRDRRERGSNSIVERRVSLCKRLKDNLSNAEVRENKANLKFQVKTMMQLPRRRLLVGYLLVALLVLVGRSGAPAAERSDRPNIVLIVADDLGYGELGCFGQKLIQTPRLDELARQGMRLTQFYSGAPVCAPSRCVLMTGKHSGHAAVRDNLKPAGMNKLRAQYQWEYPGQQPLPRDEVTIAEYLKSQGYATGAIGKWGLGQVGNSGDPARHGFDFFYGYYCQTHAHNHYPKFLWRNGVKKTLPGNNDTGAGDTHSQSQFTEEALAFIREHREEPFFLFLPFILTHVSIQVPDEELAAYKGKVSETPYEHADRYFPHATPHAGYAAMVSYLDKSVGQIVDLIDELGLADNTLIIFTSDNGPTHGRVGGADSDFFNSSGPLRARKGSAYEGGIRVPFIARWPGHIAAGSESDHVAGFVDMLPTLCEVGHAETPAKLDGISFLPTLRGKPDQKQHEFLYWEFPGYASQQAIRMGKWKAVRSGVNQGNSKFELYDLSTDIGEQHDVASEHPDVIRQAEEIVAREHVRSKVFPLLAGEKQE